MAEGLKAGKSGIRPIQAFATNPEVAPFAAEVRDFDPKKFIKNRKMIRLMARDIQLGVAAADLAIADGKLNLEEIDKTRIGVNCGAGLVATDLEDLGDSIEKSMTAKREFDIRKWGTEGLAAMYPLWMLKYLPNMPACHISIICDLQGPNNSITAGEASSILAMGESFRSISRGTADIFLTGGTDMRIHPLSVVRFALLKRLSTQHDADPSEVIRPFDRNRSGIVPGEGAGILLFEVLEQARKRNAKIVAEVLGYGSSCHSGDPAYAIEGAINQALEDAKLKPTDIGFVSANATGGPTDGQEAIGIHRVFGETAPNVPVVAFKSYYGHAFAASGSIDLIACLIAYQQGKVPPSLNFDQLDPGIPPINVLKQAIDFPKRPFLLYNMSFSGQCAAMVVKPYHD